MVAYLTVAEVAELLRLHQTTIYRMVSKGEIPFVRIGPTTLRFIRKEIEEWVGQSEKEDGKVSGTAL